MSTEAPSIGRIVHFTLSQSDADAINKRRADAQLHMGEHRAASNGVQVHVGNPASAGQVFPMLVTRLWGGSDLIQGQVFLDGNDNYWASSAKNGTGEHEWFWPPRV